MRVVSDSNPSTNLGFGSNFVHDTNSHSNFAESDGIHCSGYVEAQFSDTVTISVTIGDQVVDTLVDTGASTNIIDHAFFHSLDIARKLSVKPSHIKRACTANKSSLEISGFVKLSLSIQGTMYLLPGGGGGH